MKNRIESFSNLIENGYDCKGKSLILRDSMIDNEAIGKYPYKDSFKNVKSSWIDCQCHRYRKDQNHSGFIGTIVAFRNFGPKDGHQRKF